MNTGQKIILILIILSIISFVIFRDHWEDPKVIQNPDGTQTLGCSEGYIPKINPSNQTQVQCFKEAIFGHVKYTFFMALALAMWTGVGIVFYIEYKKRDESSVIQFLQDKYQSENKPICRSPDIYKEKGFIWTFKGFDSVISSTESMLFIGKNKLIKQVGKNLLFWGARQEITPHELFEYVNRDTKLFKRITGYESPTLIETKRIRKEGSFPKIYFPRPLPYEILKSFYSIKGNYSFGADRFKIIIRLLFNMDKSNDLLGKRMDKTFKDMMKIGEDLVSATSRTGREADNTRHTETGDSARPPQQQYEERRQI
jgi:hypothetical protein